MDLIAATRAEGGLVLKNYVDIRSSKGNGYGNILFSFQDTSELVSRNSMRSRPRFAFGLGKRNEVTQFIGSLKNLPRNWIHAYGRFEKKDEEDLEKRAFRFGLGK